MHFFPFLIIIRCCADNEIYNETSGCVVDTLNTCNNTCTIEPDPGAWQILLFRVLNLTIIIFTKHDGCEHYLYFSNYLFVQPLFSRHLSFFINFISSSIVYPLNMLCLLMPLYSFAKFDSFLLSPQFRFLIFILCNYS